MEQEAKELLDVFTKNGFDSYNVGGYVRDKLLGVPIHDIDIATSATPEQVMKLFAESIPTGIDHGTVTIPYKGYLFEVTTFRVETDYHDHRHPSLVEFVSKIELDLGRRDFTINAMAMDGSGKLIDPYGGQEDLQQRIIRAVGLPSERFREDALRILRGIRFASRFGFSIEAETWKAMQECGKLLRFISKERIRDEWRKTIEANHPIQGVKLLSVPGILPFSEWRAIFVAMSSIESEHLITEQDDDPAYRWAFLFAGGKVKNASPLLTSWKFPKKFIHEVQRYLDLIFMPLENQWEIKRCLVAFGLIKLIKAFRIRRSFGLPLPATEEAMTEWDREMPIRQVSQLALKGSDLIREFNRKPGPWVGKTLNVLFEKVAFHGMPNNRDYLLQEARKV